MFLRFVKVLFVAAISVALFACSSSASRPVHDQSKPVEASQTKGKPQKGQTAKSKQETVDATAVAPIGPPPIPQEATQRFENALTLLSAGDFARAEPELRRLADTYPEYSGALANLGILYLKTGKLTEAEKTLRAATERGPENAIAFNQLGIVYRKLGRFKEADVAYSKALAIDPNYALAHLNLGVLCDLYLQEPDRALAAYERYSALAAKPDPRVATWIKELQSRVKNKRPPETKAETKAPEPASP